MRRLHVLVVLGAQVALVLVYLGVEWLRREEPPFRWEPMDIAAPALSPSRPKGPVSTPREPHLVHFWATWCAPCQEELPALIEAARVAGVPLLAVTDEPWPIVQRYFAGRVPDAIVGDAEGGAAAAWGVSGLPDSFVVRDGRVVARMGGPRDWTTTEARAFLRGLDR